MAVDVWRSRVTATNPRQGSALLMHIAITGSTGFIGRHVVEALRRRGHSLVEILRPERRARTRSRSVADFGLDSPPPDAFERLGRPDALVHLAWAGLPNYSSPHHVKVEYPLHLNFLTTLANQGLARFVVAGTCFEYGMKEGRIQEIDPIVPVTEYARAKALLHHHFLERAPDAELLWARLFYLYGPGQSPTSLYGQFMQACESGAEHFPMSSGDQMRDYLHVEEMAEQFAQLVAVERIGSCAVNICSGSPISVRQLVEQWVKEYCSKIALQCGVYPYPSHEPHTAWGDNSRFREILGLK